jgi:hypothetical protein
VNIRKTFFSFFTLVLMLGVMLPLAKADESNQATILTFSQAVEIPGQILPAGTYRFVVVDDSTGSDTVQIFNANRTKLFATLNTVPASRKDPKDETIIFFAQRTSGKPDAIKTWFYPGMLDGHEFIYGSKEEHELAGDSKFVVTATPSDKTLGGVISGN